MTDDSRQIRDSQDVLAPLVSVITPTWRRHDLLVNRCIPSVQAQDYPRVEHVIVSDGPDEQAWNVLMVPPALNIIYGELPGHDPEEHWGHHARLRALGMASGDYITYVDDDDALRPAHCRLMAAALDATPEAGFAVSRMMCHVPSVPGGRSVTGWGPLGCGNVGTPMIMHRREILRYGTWGPASFTEDWDLVERWLDAGVTYVNVNAETSDVWPSMHQEKPRSWK